MYGFGIAEQTKTFILAFGFGFLIGILYDCLRVLRMLFGDFKKLVAIQDILFTLITFLATFSFFLAVNKGEFRGYLFLSMGLGFLVYRFSFGAFILLIFDKLFNFLKRVAEILLFPIRIIYKLIKRLLLLFLKNLKKNKKK